MECAKNVFGVYYVNELQFYQIQSSLPGESDS